MRMNRFAVVFAVMLFLPALAGAQAPAETTAPRVTFSGAYSYVRSNLNGGGANQNALGLAGAVRVSRRFSGRFDYLQLAGTKPDGKLFLFGPEYRRSLAGILPASDAFKPEKFEVFATAQAGNVRSVRPDGTKDNDFAYSVGGGLDFDNGSDGHFSLRVAEFRYVHSTLWDKGLSFKNNFVAQTGVNIRF